MDGFAYNWHSKMNYCYSSVDHSSMNSKSYVCMAVPLVLLGCYHNSTHKIIQSYVCCEGD